MEPTMTAVEMTGTVDENSQLQLDGHIPVRGPLRVRVIVLYPQQEEDEAQWWYAATRSPALTELRDAKEDIYSLDDGKPFDDEV